MLYECDNCKKVFKKKCDLERHLLRQRECNDETKHNLENKIFFCNLCGKGFSQKKSLKFHIDGGYCKKNLNENNKILIDKNEYNEYLKYKNNEINTINSNCNNNNLYQTNNFNNIDIEINNNKNLNILLNPFGKEKKN